MRSTDMFAIPEAAWSSSGPDHSGYHATAAAGAVTRWWRGMGGKVTDTTRRHVCSAASSVLAPNWGGQKRLLVARHYARHVVSGSNERASCRTSATTRRRVRHRLEERRHQGFRIVGTGQPTSIRYKLRYPTHCRRDAGQPHCHRFEQRSGDAFGARVEDERVRRREERPRIGLFTRENDRRAERMSGEERPAPLHFWTPADHEKSHRAGASPASGQIGGDQAGHVLDLDQPSHEREGKLRSKPKRCAALCAIRSVPIRRVDPVRDDDDAALRNAELLDEVVRDALVDDGDEVGESPIQAQAQPAGGAFAQLSLGVLRHDDSRDSRQAGRESELVERDEVLKMNGVEPQGRQALHEGRADAVAAEDVHLRDGEVDDFQAASLAARAERSRRPVKPGAQHLRAGAGELPCQLEANDLRSADAEGVEHLEDPRRPGRHYAGAGWRRKKRRALLSKSCKPQTCASKRMFEV